MSGAKYNSCAKCYTGKTQLGDFTSSTPATNPESLSMSSDTNLLQPSPAPLRTQKLTLKSIDTAHQHANFT